LSLLAALHGFTRKQMFEARRTLEVSIARMAAERATGEQLAAISDAVSGMFATCDDPQAFLVQDIRFHAAVGSASGNPILASVVEMISAMFYEQRRQTADRGRDLRPVADAHWQIYQAIRDREPGRAANLMSEHLIQAERDQQAEEPDEQQPGQPAK
jgi:GntR family transcriptional regulator, transcriptional repressor for pyruvate dehydrogenase complex